MAALAFALGRPWAGGFRVAPSTVVSSLPEPPTGGLQGGQLSRTLRGSDLGRGDLLAVMDLSAPDLGVCWCTVSDAGLTLSLHPSVLLVQSFPSSFQPLPCF